MLAELGCRYAIVGHSERRTLYGETDAIVAAKFKAAQAAKLVPILCVGETLEERDAGATEQTVSRQLSAVLDSAGVDAFARAVVAYEPVWAIGTGRTATPEQAQEVHAFLRAAVAASECYNCGGSDRSSTAEASKARARERCSTWTTSTAGSSAERRSSLRNFSISSARRPERERIR